MARVLSEEQRLEIGLLAQLGRSDAEIAEVVGCRRAAVGRHRRALGIAGLPRGRPPAERTMVRRSWSMPLDLDAALGAASIRLGTNKNALVIALVERWLQPKR